MSIQAKRCQPIGGRSATGSTNGTATTCYRGRGSIRSHQQQLKQDAGKDYHDTGLVFGRQPEHLTAREDDAIGMPVPSYRIRAIVAAMAKKAGLRVVRLHATRHSAATFMLNAGTPIATVARRLGHRPATLMAIYVHASDDHEAAGDEAVGALLHRKAGTTAGNRETAIADHGQA